MQTKLATNKLLNRNGLVFNCEMLVCLSLPLIKEQYFFLK